MTARVCPCYWIKPTTLGLGFGMTMRKRGGVLGYEHGACHDKCIDKGPGYCSDETYPDWDAQGVGIVRHDECGLPIPKRAWLHCGPCEE